MANPFDEFDNVDSNPFDEFDEDAKKKKGPKERNYALAALDSPIGMLEGATTGQLNALGGLGASALGGVYGMLAPGMTAKEGYEKASQKWADTAGKVLAPRSESGKIAEDLMGKAIESFKEYAADQGPKDLLGAIPFAGPELAKDEKLGGAVSAAATVLPEIGMLLPFMGIKKGAKAPEKAVEASKPEAPKAPNPFDQFDQATAERLAAGDETGQMALFDQPELMGKRNQFNAGDLGDWRVDENGMPIRVDKSMEAANVEAPLQRNLFGDELSQTGLEGNNIPLTQSIDNTPANGMWAQRRGMINRLGGNGKELLASPELEAAMMEANGMKLPFEESTMFDPKNPLPTKRLGELPDTFFDVPPKTAELPPIQWDREGQHNLTLSNGERITLDKLEHDTHTEVGVYRNGEKVGDLVYVATKDGSPQVPDIWLDPSIQKQGLGTALYDMMEREGVVLRKSDPGTRSEAAKALYASRERRQIANRMESQTALASTPLDPRDRPPIVDSVASPRSPETIAARGVKREVASRIPSKADALSEFDKVATKEEAVALAEQQGFKDNAPGVIGRNFGSGAGFAAASTNNPLIRFARDSFRDARVAAENFSKQFITDKEGISPTWSKLNDVEKVRVHQALLEGDRLQRQLTNEEMTQRGFSDLERNLVNKYYEANESMFQRWNQVLAAQGLAPVSRREGHVPGIFKGAYKALVTDEKGVTGVIAADSKYELAAAKKYFAEKHPNYTIVEQPRKGLASYKNQSDIFSGMNDILTMLAEHDPRFREVQATVAEAIKHGNNSIYAFNKHELSKKGVVGNEGNKPWLDAKKNTDAWFKSMVQYFEEGALHHELQGPLNDIRTLANDKALNMPKTMKYLDSYAKQVTGQNANNPVAGAANWAIDLGPKLLGFGPRQSLQIAGALKNRMSQLFMGWGNYVFTGAQLMQPLQTGLPFMQMAGGRLGNSLYVPKAMFNGGNAFMLSSIESMTGKNLGSIIPNHLRTANKYAEERGLHSFSEMEKAYEGQKSRLMRGVDKVAEFNMKVGELATRTPMFLSFVDLLHNSGIPVERAMPIAENMTQLAMIDYHQFERPQAYAKLGTLGQFAGGLTTFKHGYIGQQVKLAKELGRGGNPIKNAAPIGLSAAAMVALAGLTGVPFYDELDNIFGTLTDKFGGKRQNIRDAFLQNLPEWSKSGAISNATNVAVQSKFSSANMVPDSLAKAASPQLEAAYKILSDAADVAKYGDKQAWANLAMDLAPSTFKGYVEDKLLTDENGLVHNREGQGTVMRTPEGRELRKWTGLRPNDEVVQREKDFKARLADQADTVAKKRISQDFGRSVMNDAPATEKLKEFQERGGDPKSLMNIFKQKALEKKLTEEQRRNMQIKPTIGSMRKQEYYNKPGER